MCILHWLTRSTSPNHQPASLQLANYHPEPMKTIDTSWQQWIQLNIARGCDKDGIAKILFDNGFDPVSGC